MKNYFAEVWLLGVLGLVSGSVLADQAHPLTPPTAPIAMPVTAAVPSVQLITEQEIQAAQQAWADGIVAIGKAYQEKGDYQAVAAKLLDDLYAFDSDKVLFKPTKAAEDEFRETKDEALSYFVKGKEAEDHGFALQPWSKVRFDNKVTAINQDTAEAMGNYFFTDAKTGKETKVDYTFGYKRDPKDGHLRIFLHHSSLPYKPQHKADK